MKYSIITINFNNRDGLRKTIESVVNQIYKDFEYIIIDGGSTDGSVEVIKEYADKIDYWVSEPDKGIYNAMNKGILQAHGEYLNFMNSGDCFYSENTLNEVFSYLVVDIVFGKAYIIQTGTYISPRAPMSLYNFCIYGFNHQATFYKSVLFENYLYDEALQLLSDWKFTVNSVVFNQCSYNCVDLLVAKYDISGLSSRNKSLAKEEQFQILSSILPSGIYMDYYFFSQLRSPLLEDIPFLSGRYRFHKFVVKIVRSMICVYKKFYK